MRRLVLEIATAIMLLWIGALCAGFAIMVLP